MAEPDVWWDAAAGVRRSVRAAVAGRDADARELVPALVVGDDGGLDPDLADDFRTTGLTHLLAVSGHQPDAGGRVPARARPVGRGAWPLALRRWACSASCGFVLTARTEPSVVRAAAMGTVALVGMGRNGRSRGVRGLGVAVLGLLLVWPAAGRDGRVRAVRARDRRDPAAGAGLARRADAVDCPGGSPRRCRCRWRRRWPARRWWRRSRARSASSRWCANLLAAPAVAPATVLGLCRRAARPAVEPARQVAVAAPAAWSAGWIIAVARWGAGVPDGGGRLGHRTGAARAAHGAVPARGAPRPAAARPSGHDAGLHRPARRGDAGPAADPGLAAATAGCWRCATWARATRSCCAPVAGSAVVVDAGPEPAPTDACLDRLEVTAVPLVVLTHFHADHVGGVAGVLDGREVGEVEVHGAARPARGRRRCGARGRPRPGPGGVRPHAAGRRGDAADGVAASRCPPGRPRGERAQQRQRRPRRRGGRGAGPADRRRRAVGAGRAGPRPGGRCTSTCSRCRTTAAATRTSTGSPRSARGWRWCRWGRTTTTGTPPPTSWPLSTAAGASVWRTDVSGDVVVVVRDGELGVVARG